jgi:hypothetical protein
MFQIEFCPGAKLAGAKLPPAALRDTYRHHHPGGDLTEISETLATVLELLALTELRANDLSPKGPSKNC